MRSLGVLSSDSGGATGVRTRLRNQMDRLFHCSVQLIYADERSKASISSFVADRTEFWWDPKQPEKPSLWESKIELGEKFFQEIVNHPVPLEMNALKALSRSPVGLDLYLWLVYRTFALQRLLFLPWPLLYRQFGVDPDRADARVTVDNFRKDCLRELKKIKIAWPEVHDGLRSLDPLALETRNPSAGAAPARQVALPSPFPCSESTAGPQAFRQSASGSSCPRGLSTNLCELGQFYTHKHHDFQPNSPHKHHDNK